MEEIRQFLSGNGRQVVLRPAEPEDSCEILDTIRSHALERSYVLMEQYGKTLESERSYISGLDPRGNLLLVAVCDHQAIGCLAALQADAGQREETANILHLGLHLKESFRGLGIGSEMLRYAMDWARERGFKKLEASIFTTNKRSLHLFSKAGFVEEGVRKKRVYLGRDFIDEVLVGKVLE